MGIIKFPKNGFRDEFIQICTAKKLKNQMNLLGIPWIRPEDINRYEKEIGIKSIKLGDRLRNEKWLLKCISSYINEISPDNLLDIISHNHMPKNNNYEFNVSLPNKKLEGFIDFFFENNVDCRNGCSSCNYCQKKLNAIRTSDGDLIKLKSKSRTISYK